MNINIRKATVQDAKGISKLITSLTAKYICPTCDDSMHNILLRSMSESKVTEYLSDDYDYVVATNDKHEIIGVSGIRDKSHLYHLFVSDDYQGQGLSRKLWENVKSEALKNGNQGRFTVNSAVNSESVYLKFGFVRTEGIRNREGMIDIPMVLESTC